jgi:hypothetical protein
MAIHEGSRRGAIGATNHARRAENVRSFRNQGRCSLLTSIPFHGETMMAQRISTVCAAARVGVFRSHDLPFVFRLTRGS